MFDPPPTQIFVDVSADLFELAGNHYMVNTNRLSGYPQIAEFVRHDLTSRDVVIVLFLNFASFGVPTRLRTDGGPEFT